jgi:Domain of unknown function (DUF4118)
MRALKGMFPIVMSVGLILAVTAILWRLTLTTESSDALVYIYLFPVALIAVLYNGRLALLSAATAMVCADYFLQEPLYSLANDNPREYGDLLFSPFWLPRRSSLSEYWCDPTYCWPNHVRRGSSGSLANVHRSPRLITRGHRFKSRATTAATSPC